MIEDRTKAHADHVGHGHERITTAAVGKCQMFEGPRARYRQQMCCRQLVLLKATAYII